MANPSTEDAAISLFFAFVAAVIAALALGYIAHYDFGFSREEIRTPAVTAAAVIGLLLATEQFRKRLRKPK
jgi:hypothetical protein